MPQTFERVSKLYTEGTEGKGLLEAVVAYRWLTEVFQRAIEAIPRDLRGKLEPAELFHEVLDHRWYLSEQAGSDVGTLPAVASYVQTVLQSRPSERLPEPPQSATSR